jgi:hypothetical protein
MYSLLYAVLLIDRLTPSWLGRSFLVHVKLLERRGEVAIVF